MISQLLDYLNSVFALHSLEACPVPRPLCASLLPPLTTAAANLFSLLIYLNRLGKK